MEKSWSQLADRCSLFFDAPDGLYKELLKEAEQELANKCSLYTKHYTYQCTEEEISNALQGMHDTLADLKEKDHWSDHFLGGIFG